MFNINLTALITALSFLLFVYFFNKTFWFPVSQIRKQREDELENNKSQAVNAEKQTHEIVQEIKVEIESIKKAEHESFERVFGEIDAEKKKAEADLKNQLKLEKQKTFSEIAQERLNLDLSMQSKAQTLSESIIQKIAPEIKIKIKIN